MFTVKDGDGSRKGTNTDRNLNYLDLCPDSPVLLCMARRTEPREKLRSGQQKTMLRATYALDMQ